MSLSGQPNTLVNLSAELALMLLLMSVDIVSL